MKKKLLSIILTVVLVATLTACGGKETETTAPVAEARTETETSEEAESPVEEAAPEDETADEMVSDENFAILQDNYALMVECYNAVSELYSSDEIAADPDIEEAMQAAAEVIEEMGEITQDLITDEDAEALNGAMEDILNALSDLVDGMETTGDASGDMVSDKTFAVLQETYQAMAEAYNAVAEAYNSDEVEADADIEDALNQAYEIIDEMGTISQDSITEEDAETLIDAMAAIVEVLSVVVDAM